MRAGLIIVQNDTSCGFGVFLGPFPAFHGSAHKAHHLVHERGVIKVVFQRIDAVLKRGDALIFVFECHQFILGNASIQHLPVFIVGHGRNTVSFAVKQRVDIEPLLEHRHAIVAAIGRNTRLAHPAQERVFIAKEPDTDGLAPEILDTFNARVFPAGQHQTRGLERLRDVHHRQTLFAGCQRRWHPVQHHISATTGQHLRRRDVRATGQDRHVQPFLFIKTLIQGHIVPRKLRLRDPLQLQRHFIRAAIGLCHAAKSCGQCRCHHYLLHFDLLVS